MNQHPDFRTEPVPGLPEALPKGEKILWQGRPDTWHLAVEACGLYWVGCYFVLLVLWRVGVSSGDLAMGEALLTGVPFILLGVAATAIVWLIAWAQARATVYTITSARVVMRIGAALPVTFNIPFSKVENVWLDLRSSGTGTIALQVTPVARISYMVMWPHIRPWHVRKPEPAIRAIPDAARIAGLLAQAAETHASQPVLTRMCDTVAAE
ncbi:MAG: PH domain-containing protein [Rhodobacteraceae bacterium]|nr:PH domain-containing protein [Paracoccaceae bacterium]